MTRNSNRWWLYVKIAAYILIPLVLLILPADFFDEGRSICLSVLLLGEQCYACGLTRALQHLIHFEFVEAYYYNVLAFIVFPAFAWYWWKWFWADWKQLRALTDVEMEQEG